MDEKFIRQAFAELIESTGEAVGYFAAAVARAGDAERLAQEMRAQISAAETVGRDRLAIRIAKRALAALDAEVMIQWANPTTQ